MKKVIAFLLALMLPLCAGAETAQGFHIKLDPMLTSTKKTEILFDADVFLPEFEDIPLYNVSLLSFSEEDMQAIANGFGFPKDAKPKLEKYDDSSSSYKGYSMDLYTFSHDKKKLCIFNEFISGKPFGSSYTFELEGEAAEYTTSDKLLPVNEGAYEDMAVAQAQAELLAAKIAPGLSLNASGTVSGSPWSYGDEPSLEKASLPLDLAYMFIFSRTIHQVPITVTGTRMGSGNEYVRVIPEEQLSIIVKDGKVIRAQFFSPYQMAEAELVNGEELIAFEKMMEIAQYILPLICMSRESQWATEEKPEQLIVHRISFGYTRINDKDNPNEYKLVPTWDFFVSHTHQWRQYENGTHIIREVKENYAIESYLTINAIDGTVIDRNYGY